MGRIRSQLLFLREKPTDGCHLDLILAPRITLFYFILQFHTSYDNTHVYI